ncbi:MAG: DUF1552 domain-containing protein [Myxococcota bacterium]
MRKPSRRSFLKTMGSVSLALPFARLLESSIVHAQSARPRRLLILMSPHGNLINFWRPQAVGTDFNIDYANSMLGPLRDFKNKIVVLDGVDYKVLYEKATTGHDYGHCTFLTGTAPAPRGSEVYPTGPSIDQVVGQRLTGICPRDTLSLGVFRLGGTTNANSMIFSQAGERVQSLIDPAAIYPMLFTGVVPPGGGSTPPDPAATAEARRKLALVTYLNGEATRLRPRLAGQERQKLEQHIEALAAIERRLGGPKSGSSAGASCDPALISGGTLNPRAEGNIPELIDLQFDIIAQTFACDLTRVISFQFLQGGDPTPMPWLGLTGDLHDGLAHLASGTNAAAMKLIEMQRWYSTKVAELFARLDAIQDPQGGSVLDNTVVLWGNELGDPSMHSSVNIPMLMAGGGAGAFVTGRHIRYSTSPEPRCSGVYGSCPSTDPFRDQTAHNQVLTSIAQMFGIDIDHFGDEKYTGTAPGLV